MASFNCAGTPNRIQIIWQSPRLPQSHAILYYSQWATEGGLMIAEVAGVPSDAQGMSLVFFCQIWHVGRASDMEEEPISSTDKPVEKNEDDYMKFQEMDHLTC
ncbi:putative 12-oxophytodienoate reductase 12 isoform X2 [Phragmites australis]|uniref:putative 12-oxophytodienoate reductase 12 isoform X2 n=1 Tax=Phragmites australis TaxID=29695 RepID=UPI002D76D8D0|nr:putative 12-oxophytodienoate reductase 12 isoform X2 [Phragmites australis]